MKCSKCGTDFNGKYCPICGTENSYAKFRSLLTSDSERVEAVLGNSIAQTFLATGQISNGFAVLSNKRVYFKGKTFTKKGSFYYIQKEEHIIDVRNVTGTGFVYNKPLWMQILGFILLAFTCLCVAITVTTAGATVALMIPASYLFLPAGIILLVLYKKFTANIFQVNFAGGCIGINTYWSTKEEIEVFQKTLRTIKDAIESTPTYVVTNDSISNADELKKYQELLDSGVITQEEFDAKKKEILGL